MLGRMGKNVTRGYWSLVLKDDYELICEKRARRSRKARTHIFIDI